MNNRYPQYPDDADYQTNAPSYYDDLARKDYLIKILSKRVWEYDKTLNMKLEEIEKVLEEMIYKIGEGFNEEIYDLLILWVEDGTLDHIINVTLMNKKADITYVDDEIKQLKELLIEKITENEENISNFKEEITEELVNGFIDLNDELAKHKKDVDKKLKDLSKHVPVNHIYSEEYPNLQEAIYAAEGGVLHIRRGNYNISTPHKIRSNTKIYAYGSTFRRTGNINNMFINDSDGEKGGYSANNNIAFIGGTFDASGGSYSDNCTILAFGHAMNVKILDSTFKNLRNWHMIELNACQNVLIQNCLFEDYGTSIMGTEMVQIDVSKSTTEFPWFAPYDNTTCDNIKITRCKFINGVRGIGTHSAGTNAEHTRITITENEFSNMSGEAIKGMDWSFTKINDNHFYNVWIGIILNAWSRSNNNHEINNNYISGKFDTLDSRAIRIIGYKDDVKVVAGTIKNNKIRRFNTHGIGIDNCEKWVVDGNDIDGNGANGIAIYGGKYITINGNISKNNRLNKENTYDLRVYNGAYYVTINGNILNTVEVDTSPRYIFFTGNTVLSSLTFSSSGTRVSTNNFVNEEHIP